MILTYFKEDVQTPGIDPSRVNRNGSDSGVHTVTDEIENTGTEVHATAGDVTSSNQIQRSQTSAAQNAFDNPSPHSGQIDGPVNRLPGSPLAYSDTASRRGTTGTSHRSQQNAASPHSPGMSKDRRQEHGTHDFASPLKHSQTFARQQRSPLSSNHATGINHISNQVVSPSVSYDGIFEPGSTYADLFHELRSHVFRTAAHPEPVSFDGNATEAPDAAASACYPMEDHNMMTSDVVGECQGVGQDDGTQNFDLPPAQEYILWKAWTEEVSTWVCQTRSRPS